MLLLDNQPTVASVWDFGCPIDENDPFYKVATTCFKNLLTNVQLSAVVIYCSLYSLEKFLPDLPPEQSCVFLTKG